MIAFKGFSKDLKSVHGNGKAEDCCFVPGETKTAQRSKTQREGYHCTENVFDCLRWHPLGGSSRIWKVEASGDIDEGQDCQISCTQITLVKELTILEIAMEGMMFMIKHHRREGWQQDRHLLSVKEDQAEAEAGGIAIARGKDPRVKGQKDSILGIIIEDEGEIRDAGIMKVKKEHEGKWMRLRDHEWEEADEI